MAEYEYFVIMIASELSLVELVLRTICELFQISFGFLYHWLCCLGMVCQTFIIDHILKQVFGRFEIIPIPVKSFFAYDLLFFIVKTVKVRMGQALFDCVSLVWIESQHFR